MAQPVANSGALQQRIGQAAASASPSGFLDRFAALSTTAWARGRPWLKKMIWELGTGLELKNRLKKDHPSLGPGIHDMEKN